MRIINQETWSRREHFKLFGAFAQPHFAMIANVDLTAFYPLIKVHGYSFTAAIIYIIARTANAIPEFRYRLRGGEVVEHEIVHPSTTILYNEDLFCFCTIEYTEDFLLFMARAGERFADVREHPTLENESGRDDLLFMSPIPWVSFTSFTHPLPTLPADSVPRFAWGKLFAEGGLLKMPLNVQGHHALMDGIHMGRFYTYAQDNLHHPDFIPGQG